MELDTLESFVIRGSTVFLTQNFAIHKDWNTAFSNVKNLSNVT